MLALETNPHDNFRKLAEVGDKWTTGVLEAEGVSPVDRLRILRALCGGRLHTHT